MEILLATRYILEIILALREIVEIILAISDILEIIMALRDILEIFDLPILFQTLRFTNYYLFIYSDSKTSLL